MPLLTLKTESRDALIAIALDAPDEECDGKAFQELEDVKPTAFKGIGDRYFIQVAWPLYDFIMAKRKNGEGFSDCVLRLASQRKPVVG